MTGVWIAVIVAGAALVVLAAVAAASVGPVRSLLRSVEGLDEVTGELERLRRSLDVVRSRVDEVARRGRGEGPEGP